MRPKKPFEGSIRLRRKPFARGLSLARFRWLLVVLAPLIPGPLWAHTSTHSDANFQIVESVPKGTAYGDPTTARTADVWVDMIRGAQKTIDIAAFYISEKPNGPLSPILKALEERAHDGVHIRILVDQSFLKGNADAVDQLRQVPGIVVRVFPVSALTGGVLHAKYMIVDSTGIFVGSQNWDWRAIDEIHEVGVRIVNGRLAQTFDATFEFDWQLAETKDLPKAAIDAVKPPSFSPATDADPVLIDNKDGDPLVVFPAFSPPSLMPRWVTLEQSSLVNFIQRTHHILRIQVMTLSAIRHYGPDGWWPELDTAIRDAAARGVDVHIIVADWALREPMQSYLKSLAALPHITIRFTRVPESAEGFIPFARVEHAKYAIFDDRSIYVGTGNWEWSYFNNTVDASLFFEGTQPAQTLARIFDRDWDGPYATNLTLESHDTAPRNH
jgi:phosphatidylserine/phosphatidylglycerophosphate/cardiolipin synthase-like enzyme